MDRDEILPSTMPIGRLDTGIPLNPRLAALLVGLGDGMASTYNLIDGQFNPERQKMNNDGITKLLMGEYGTQARLGQIGGIFADPANLALIRALKKGAP